MSNYRWFPAITAAFATSLVISNIIAVKLVTLGPLVLPAAFIIFQSPIFSAMSSPRSTDIPKPGRRFGLDLAAT